MRFPEFNDEWQEYKLSDIAEIVEGGTPDTGKEEYWNGDIQWFTPTEIKTDYVSKSQRTISNLGLKESSAKLLPKGTILLTTRATIGDTAIALQECATNQGFQSLIVKDNNNIFVYNWLKTIKPELIKKANGSTFLEISKNEVENILIKIPSYAEQTKIANFLSLIDQLCQYQMKIIEGLTSFKSAVSKKIFSQELRFSSLDIKWEKVKLKEVCEKQSSNISANKIEDNFGDYLIYGASGKLKTVDFYEVEDDYISVVKDGAGVGRLLYCKGKSSVLGTLDIIKPKNGINPYFLYCLLLNIDFGKYITGSTIPHIYFKDYSNEIIEMPLIEEQIKIANFLSCIDQKVNLEIALLQQLKSQKQYLLQQLFI